MAELRISLAFLTSEAEPSPLCLSLPDMLYDFKTVYLHLHWDLPGM